MSAPCSPPGVEPHRPRVQPRKRGVDEPSSIYTRFLGRIDKAAEVTGIAYLEAVRKSILESPVKVREHIKTDDKGNVLMKEIHRETLPPDIRGALWWLERRFPEQFGRRGRRETMTRFGSMQSVGEGEGL